MVGVGGRISSGCYGDDEQGDGDDAAELDQTFGFVWPEIIDYTIEWLILATVVKSFN